MLSFPLFVFPPFDLASLSRLDSFASVPLFHLVWAGFDRRYDVDGGPVWLLPSPSQFLSCAGDDLLAR